jgi:nucleotide-binding universal stress UspA family protein
VYGNIVMRKILVPHDGYEMSDKALKYAIEIAKAMHMKIIILRVVPHVIADSSIIFLHEKEQNRIKRNMVKINQQVKMQIYNHLAKQLTMCSSEGVRASRMVVIGDPVEKILSVARREDPYLLIIGSRKLKGLGKLRLLGSVARKVSEEAECPVTIVH